MTKKASSTVFLSLILLVVASLLFTLLESARVSTLKVSAKLSSEVVTESLLAEYNRPLLERYHLFALDAGYGTNELSPETVCARAKALFDQNDAIPVEACTLTKYQLLTDNKGEVFFELVTNYMKNNITQEAAKRIFNEVQKAEGTKEEAGDVDKKRTDAMNGIAEAEAAAEQASTEQIETEQTEAEQATAENPIEYVLKWKDTGILTLVGVDSKELSNMAIDRKACLEKRQKNTGNYKVQNTTQGWYEKILFEEYLLEYFGSYTSPKEDTALNYELEYIIAGQSCDRENLADVATILLAIREAANFVYLQTDQAKCKEALTLATLLVGFTGNAVLVKSVQQGILAAWAFAESVSDVKSLLSGERIPIIKTAAQWSTNVSTLSQDQAFGKSKKCTGGLSYEDYLRILLYTVSPEKKSYRAMDLMEQNIRLTAGPKTVRMDCMINQIKMNYNYTAKPLFLTLVTIGDISVKGYKISVEQEENYLEN